MYAQKSQLARKCPFSGGKSPPYAPGLMCEVSCNYVCFKKFLMNFTENNLFITCTKYIVVFIYNNTNNVLSHGNSMVHINK